MDTQVMLVGADKSVWHLRDGREGVRLALGVGGLDLGTWSQLSTQAARQAGRTYRGTRYDARKLPLTIHVGDTDNRDEPRRGAQWLTLDRTFRAAISPERTCRIVVTSNSGYRWWDVRLDEYTPASLDRDPAILGTAVYNAVFVADDPFPRSFPHTQTVGAGQTVAIPNAGEVEAWRVYTVDGPITGTSVVTVGSGTQLTTLPPLTQGQRLVFDSDPSRRTVVDGAGVSRRGEMTVVDRRSPIPAGSFSPTSCTFTGEPPSKVTVAVPLRFRAAW